MHVFLADMFLSQVIIYLRSGCGGLPKSEQMLRQAKVLDHLAAIAWASMGWWRVREALGPLHVLL